MLGNAETVGIQSEHFFPVAKQKKITQEKRGLVAMSLVASNLMKL